MLIYISVIYIYIVRQDVNNSITFSYASKPSNEQDFYTNFLGRAEIKWRGWKRDTEKTH